MDIFVGSLSFKLKESELREAFEKFGTVSSAKIIIDKITRQSKGFGFVEMPDEEEARLAISNLNGADMYGRPLVVNESQKKEARTDAGAPRREGGFTRPPRTEGSSTDRPSSPGTGGSTGGGGYSGGGGGGYSGGDKSSGGGNNDRYRSSDRGQSGGYGDKGGFGGKPRSDDRFGKGGADHKRGGGGSKNYSRNIADDDDDY
ncbi:RNA-binding protein [Dyadobacter sp. LJ53]|uniref:RNA recognition motif domain-containing protein n=1 Tax=Dyadobacter chenwenxiniae TaxID=2906456 RepID=UPI001F427B4A|nr:RNA-binding protein [Dyadobacter chenwenxiniae]MCF0050225.1 RNA-binding protein [Dyadobacter chenwenxiniae]